MVLHVQADNSPFNIVIILLKLDKDYWTYRGASCLLPRSYKTGAGNPGVLSAVVAEQGVLYARF